MLCDHIITFSWYPKIEPLCHFLGEALAISRLPSFRFSSEASPVTFRDHVWISVYAALFRLTRPMQRRTCIVVNASMVRIERIKMLQLCYRMNNSCKLKPSLKNLKFPCRFPHFIVISHPEVSVGHLSMLSDICRWFMLRLVLRLSAAMPCTLLGW